MARAKTPAKPDASLADEADFGVDLENAEVIATRVDLRKKVKQRPSRQGDRDPVADAEAAVQELAASFDGWMRGEIDKLLGCWQEAAESLYSDEARDALFRAAHDIKGQAATLGYPLVGDAAASLCNLLLAGPAGPDLPLGLVDQHVQAIRAMIREEAREENRTARLLADRLTTVTDEFLASVARAA